MTYKSMKVTVAPGKEMTFGDLREFVELCEQALFSSGFRVRVTNSLNAKIKSVTVEGDDTRVSMRSHEEKS